MSKYLWIGLQQPCGLHHPKCPKKHSVPLSKCSCSVYFSATWQPVHTSSCSDRNPSQASPPLCDHPFFRCIRRFLSSDVYIYSPVHRMQPNDKMRKCSNDSNNNKTQPYLWNQPNDKKWQNMRKAWYWQQQKQQNTAVPYQRWNHMRIMSWSPPHQDQQIFSRTFGIKISSTQVPCVLIW